MSEISAQTPEPENPPAKQDSKKVELRQRQAVWRAGVLRPTPESMGLVEPGVVLAGWMDSMVHVMVALMEMPNPSTFGPNREIYTAWIVQAPRRARRPMPPPVGPRPGPGFGGMPPLPYPIPSRGWPCVRTSWADYDIIGYIDLVPAELPGFWINHGDFQGVVWGAHVLVTAEAMTHGMMPSPPILLMGPLP